MRSPSSALRVALSLLVVGGLVTAGALLMRPRVAPPDDCCAPSVAPAPARPPVAPTAGPAPAPSERDAPVASPPAVAAAEPGLAPGSTSRWYEVLREGAKTGWTHVVWSPSTFDGKPTVRDVTTATSREVRQMLGTEDVFESTTVQTTERDADGVLLSTSAESTERGGRVTTQTITWTGTGYDSVTRVVGATEAETSEERRRVDASAPAHVDAEALVSARVAAGRIVVGDAFTRRQLNVLAGRVEEVPVVVVADEEVDAPSGHVKAWKLKETDPRSRGETLFWIDHDGAVVRLKDLSTEVRRVSGRAEAEKAGRRRASFSITAKATPVVQRVFSADAFDVEVGVRRDADRPRPEFPDSPWSRTLAVEGDDATGFTVRMRLTAHDAKDASAKIPVKDPAFAPYLEPTALMPCMHPDVKGAAFRAVAGETDARKAAQRIADFVYTLDKESPEVAEASALEILRDRKGDCSEHALLFVALCRASGIPARRCSGFVCVGTDWGSHAWAEIWCGAWIGVDPTTNDVGTAARYLFFGYGDDGDSQVGVVSARARGRLSFRGLSIREGEETADLTASTLFGYDEAAHRAYDVRSGLRLDGIPEGATVDFDDDVWTSVSLADGGSVALHLMADQGMRTMEHLRRVVGGRAGTFAGRPAAIMERGTTRFIAFGSRKRVIVLRIQAGAGNAPTLDALTAAVATWAAGML